MLEFSLCFNNLWWWSWLHYHELAGELVLHLVNTLLVNTSYSTHSFDLVFLSSCTIGSLYGSIVVWLQQRNTVRVILTKFFFQKLKWHSMMRLKLMILLNILVLLHSSAWPCFYINLWIHLLVFHVVGRILSFIYLVVLMLS